MSNKSVIGTITGWVLGMVFLAIGLINTFWGNDSLFGVFIVLLSLVFLPPVHALVREKIGFSIPVIAKIALGIFIVWASLGVGELFDKIDLMVKDLL